MLNQFELCPSQNPGYTTGLYAFTSTNLSFEILFAICLMLAKHYSVTRYLLLQ